MPAKIKKDALERALFERGFSLNKLAKYTGISKAYLSQLKNGKRNPSQEVIEKILKVLKVYKLSDLFDWEPKEDKVLIPN